MHVVRLTKPSQILEHWRLLEDGFMFLRRAAREDYDSVQMQKHLCALASSDKAWIGVVIENDGTPISFGIAEDISMSYATTRIFEIRSVYHRPAKQEATLLLAQAFYDWGKQNNVSRCRFITKRNNPASIRCLRNIRYGFEKPYLVFEKEIK